jgi:hypothetical protein
LLSIQAPFAQPSSPRIQESQGGRNRWLPFQKKRSEIRHGSRCDEIKVKVPAASLAASSAAWRCRQLGWRSLCTGFAA